MDLVELAKKVIEKASIVDIVSHYLPLVKTGKNFKAVCPFHEDTNPSLTVSPDKKIFKCFVCGTGGNAITFVQKYENTSFRDAIRRVCEISHINIPELDALKMSEKKTNPLQKEFDALAFISKFYQVVLSSEGGSDALNYITNRFITEEQVRKFKIGFSPTNGTETIKMFGAKNLSLKTLEDVGVAVTINGEMADRFNSRVVFSIMDSNGDVVGFSGRTLSTNKEISKYLNSPESPVFLKSKILYNYSEIKRVVAIKKHVYITEGFMDVIALDRFGIPAVATMGTSLSSDHLKLLRTLKCEIKVLMDGDNAGRLASLKISRLLFLNSFNVRVIHNSQEKRDPDEIIRDNGEEGLSAYLKNELSYLDFLNDYYRDLLIDNTKTDEYLKLAFEGLSFLESIDLIAFEKAMNKVAGTLRANLQTVDKQYQKYSKSKEIAALGASTMNGTPQDSSFLDRKDRPIGLRRSELYMVSMMMQSKDAVSYFLENLNNFADPLCQEIADFIIEVSRDNVDYDSGSLIAILDSQEGFPDKDELKKIILDLSVATEENPDARYSKDACADLVNKIQKKQKEHGERQILDGIKKNTSLSEKDRLRATLDLKRQHLNSKKKK